MSPVIASPTSKLRWRCASGHEWLASIATIGEGRWCLACERWQLLRKRRLAELKAVAARCGGECLSECYVGNHDPMRWRCEHAHEWEASSVSILNGSWCPFCSGRRTTLAALQALAAKHGGECLSTEPGRKGDLHRWRCAQGHEWFAAPSRILEGRWCWTCPRPNAVTFASLQELARSRGGECLSHHYSGVRHLAHWRCEAGHEWQANVNPVKNEGTWCPTCAGNIRGDLEHLQEVARERGGECLATNYVNSRTHVPWRCAEGHTWDAVPSQLVAGHWCPTCSRPGRPPRYWTHADLAALCHEHGGRILLNCPDDTRIHGDSKATFRCALGHSWTTTVHIVCNGHWCPECAGVARGNLAALQALAAERGGRCLAPEYINGRTPVPFECAKGHRWNARPSSVKRTWCPHCAPTRRLDLEMLGAVAKARGGRCLADVLPGRDQPIEWACAEGHRWMARPTRVNAGSWCPKCRGRGTYTLERARTVAAEHGGKCQSPACSRASDRLSWRCREGHTWTASAKCVLSRGSWCPCCGRQRAAASLRKVNVTAG